MLSVRDIETKTFSRSKTGYKEEEVEAFLDEIIVDYTALLEEKESLGKKVIVLSEKLETIRDEQEARMQSLLSTQKSYDEVMRTAKMNAESLINDAKKKADELLKAAKEQADGLTSEATAKAVEIEKDGEEKKAEYNALVSEIETVKKAVHVLCDKFTSDVENLPELAKKELAAVTVTVPATQPAPAVEETKAVPEETAPVEVDDTLMAGETKVIPVVKETKIADVPRDVTREKINRALEIADEEDEDMVGDDDDEDYENSFYTRKHGSKKDDGRAAKIRNLFGSDDDYSDEDEDDDKDDFDDEYEEKPKKKKRSFFGFGKKKKSRDDDYDDYDDYDDDDYDEDDDDYYDDED